MVKVDIYFYNNEHIHIDNVIMIETISNRLAILFNVESYKDYTEVKYYSMSDIDYYLVGK